MIHKLNALLPEKVRALCFITLIFSRKNYFFCSVSVVSFLRYRIATGIIIKYPIKSIIGASDSDLKEYVSPLAITKNPIMIARIPIPKMIKFNFLSVKYSMNAGDFDNLLFTLAMILHFIIFSNGTNIANVRDT